jgi:AraC-like DNA-binding protein
MTAQTPDWRVRCDPLLRGEADLRIWQPEIAEPPAGLLASFLVEGRLSRGPVASGSILPSNGIHLSYVYEGHARSHRDRQTWGGWSISHGAREPTRFEMSRDLTLLKLTLDPELLHRALGANTGLLRDMRGPLEAFEQLAPLAAALAPVASAPTPQAALAAAHQAVQRMRQLADRAPPRPAGDSERSAQRSFLQGNAVPQREYIAVERFQRVASLLAESELSLAEIALACGFWDQAHLNRAVRHFTGHSPLQFRNALRHSPFTQLYMRARGQSRILAF